MGIKNISKNSACACLGLFFIAISALVMVQIFYNTKIDAQISNVSILKDIRYTNWGKHPNPSGSEYKQTFSLYNLEQIVPMLIIQDGHLFSVKSNTSKTYQYHYQYQNASFAQGNLGRLNFINKWELKQITANAPSEENIKTTNLGADKVFNYDYYAPPQRKFAIMYNYIRQTITGAFLQKFYTAYLHEFYFKYKDLVLDTVFKPIGFDQPRASSIYDDSTYGWITSQQFGIWVKLSLLGHQEAVKTQQYETLIVNMKLTTKQIQALVFEKSTLYNMIAALNGTIKSKLMMPGIANFNYKCSQASCSNHELAAFQIADAFLTSDPLFSSLNINTSIKGLNSTFLNEVEYSKFCQRNSANFKCMSKSNMIKFFTQNILGDFESMNFLWKNKDNYAIIQSHFDLENSTGQSVSAYAFYLYSEFIGKYEQSFAWAQTNFNNIQSSVMTYKNLLLVELYSRAFYNKFLQNKEVKCTDYFTGEFSQYGNEVCALDDGTKDSWNFVMYFPSLRKIIQAYLFIEKKRQVVSEVLKISHRDQITFFNSPQKSLFAAQLQEIESIFKSSFRCPNNDLTLCSSDQLFCMQWGSNKIFQNLPIDIFSNKIKSINEWDTQNVLNGLNPDYHAVVGVEKSVEQCQQMLSSSSNAGIFNLFNILKMTKQSTMDSDYRNALKYIGRSVVQIAFNGLLNNQTVGQLFSGFQSNLIVRKKDMNVSSGGAPWLQNNLKLVKTDNKAEIKNNELLTIPQFDTINTGIYNQDKTRQISKIWGQTTSSSKYTVYQGTKTNDEGQEIQVDIFEKYVTDRKVTGTNLLGFHPFVEQGQNLQIFVSQAYQPMTLTYDQTIQFESKDLSKSIKAYKYKVVLNSDAKNINSYIGIEQLNQNYFTLDQESKESKSYVIVQPTTGLTLQLSLKFTIKTDPLFAKFLLDDQSNLVNLYSSQLSYKRNGLSEIQQIANYKSSKKLFSIIAIVVGIVSFISVIIFLAMFKRVAKVDSTQETLLSSDQIVSSN